ncbi:ribosome biogenesis protein BOP1 [Elysia marginata]|uniref:Ribosome biogenesis protein BOP1 homolog n=1 Tax=Elysia marginata TaxID=1093978 RepID=A0AAV4EEX1_9GAST|nr:ribosome biogenesis protein BOP1 [Elysia marginata]
MDKVTTKGKGKRKAKSLNEDEKEIDTGPSLLTHINTSDAESEASGDSEEEKSDSEESSSEEEGDTEEDDSDETDSDDDDDGDAGYDSDNVEKAQSSADPDTRLPSENGKDEYEYDSSDEEDVRNTIGNIPVNWYDEYDHIGYDVEGNKLIKPKQADALDEFLAKVDDPNYWRTVKNKSTGQKVLLSEEDLKQIQRIQSSTHPGGSDDLYAPEITKRYRMHIPAPKEPLPGHAESYNPPEEYLFDEEEEAKWDGQEPEERRMDFKPEKFGSYRSVPKYEKFINDRFHRLLDLYMASRQRKMKMNVNPEDLIPKRPEKKDLQPYPTREGMIYKDHKDMVRTISPDPSGQWLASEKKDLQPYPTREGMIYKDHKDMVRTISPDPSGQWLASGSDDATVKVWEIATGRCMKTIPMAGKVTCVVWNPNPAINLIAASVGSDVVLINPNVGDKLLSSNTDSMLDGYTEAANTSDQKSPVTWSTANTEEHTRGVRLKIEHQQQEIVNFTWHAKGDYFATVQKGSKGQAVLIHQLSRRQTQAPFSKPKGLVQRVIFHPVHPYFFVATQQHIRIYNLVKQELHKKLQANCKYISSIDIHPGGDNLIIGSYDSRLCWFDLDLSTKPYQTLKYHKKALRQVAYHKHYPLFASASDDGSIIVSHGKVFTDQLLNPLIVTVKILRGHKTANHLSVLDCKFHPTQPWVFSSGADGTIRLFV